MAKHFGDKLEKWYIGFCPKCHTKGSIEIRVDEMRKIKVAFCKTCGNHFGWENIKNSPKYYQIKKPKE